MGLQGPSQEIGQRSGDLLSCRDLFWLSSVVGNCRRPSSALPSTAVARCSSLQRVRPTPAPPAGWGSGTPAAGWPAGSTAGPSPPREATGKPREPGGASREPGEQRQPGRKPRYVRQAHTHTHEINITHAHTHTTNACTHAHTRACVQTVRARCVAPRSRDARVSTRRRPKMSTSSSYIDIDLNADVSVYALPTSPIPSVQYTDVELRSRRVPPTSRKVTSYWRHRHVTPTSCPLIPRSVSLRGRRLRRRLVRFHRTDELASRTQLPRWPRPEAANRATGRAGQSHRTRRSVPQDVQVSPTGRAGQSHRLVPQDAQVSLTGRAGQSHRTCGLVPQDAQVSPTRRAGQSQTTRR